MILYTNKEWQEKEDKRKLEWQKKQQQAYEKELDAFISHLNDCVDDKGSDWVSTGVFPKKTQP